MVLVVLFQYVVHGGFRRLGEVHALVVDVSIVGFGQEVFGCLLLLLFLVAAIVMRTFFKNNFGFFHHLSNIDVRLRVMILVQEEVLW